MKFALIVVQRIYRRPYALNSQKIHFSSLCRNQTPPRRCGLHLLCSDKSELRLFRPLLLSLVERFSYSLYRLACYTRSSYSYSTTLYSCRDKFPCQRTEDNYLPKRLVCQSIGYVNCFTTKTFLTSLSSRISFSISF